MFRNVHYCTVLLVATSHSIHSLLWHPPQKLTAPRCMCNTLANWYLKVLWNWNWKVANQGQVGSSGVKWDQAGPKGVTRGRIHRHKYRCYYLLFAFFIELCAWGKLYSGTPGMLQITHVANCTCCKLHMWQIARFLMCTCCRVHELQIACVAKSTSLNIA